MHAHLCFPFFMCMCGVGFSCQCIVEFTLCLMILSRACAGAGVCSAHVCVCECALSAVVCLVVFSSEHLNTQITCDRLFKHHLTEMFSLITPLQKMAPRFLRTVVHQHVHGLVLSLYVEAAMLLLQEPVMVLFVFGQLKVNPKA